MTPVITGHSGPSLLLLLAMAHFLCDFGLQGDRMAREKCPGRDVTLFWGWWLLSHSAIHGLAVALLTDRPLLGLAEAVLHAGIDRLKCAGCYNLAVDQVLHLACKALWVALLPRL
ncbi:MAG: DUF3307 domain-containing protein [Synechococcaceae cyanobacterium]|nr:DUF3307 domain-containing protein [Synechococcaceae cyanobacterium]